MSEKDRSGAIEAVQWLNATGVLDQIVRDIIVPPLVAAIKAEAIATARAEGRREGLEEAAAMCDSYVGDSDGSTWQDAAMVTRDKLAAAIRELAQEVTR